MTRTQSWTLIAILAAVAGFVCFGILRLTRAGESALTAWSAAPANLQKVVETLPSLADEHLTTLQGKVDKISDKADARIAAIQQDAKAELASTRELLVAESKAWRTQTTEIADNFRGDLKPVLAGALALEQNANDSWNDLYWDVKSSVESVTVAANSVGQASIEVKQSVPKALVNWDLIAQNVVHATDESAKTAEQSRKFMANLAEASKPLPLPLRIGLAVAPPVAQTAFTVASWWTLKGRASK